VENLLHRLVLDSIYFPTNLNFVALTVSEMKVFEVWINEPLDYQYITFSRWLCSLIFCEIDSAVLSVTSLLLFMLFLTVIVSL